MTLKTHKVKVTELMAVVQGYLGWEPGTGAIERIFTQQQNLFSSGRRATMSRQREQDILTLIAEYREREVDEIVEMAIAIWKERYHNTRENNNTALGQHRADFGTKRKRKTDDNGDHKTTLSRFISN